MAGLSKGERGYSPEESSDPINPTNQVPDRSAETASSLTESIHQSLQPGDTKATTRRLSDTPSNTQASRDWIPVPHGGVGDQDKLRRQEQEREEYSGKSMLQRAQETVAKALGGGSRGAT
ncbi:hypothetical protein MPDQ_004575 [Monascus purpureus]|uniref:Uncharacterized protein n=1 Tax=Monascus purpureus TaxID=5098 RepID=A0A507R597_MONPU|nr:hypothetical protein MPDQ_004575 [Monascus purpureus]BDD61604.1 hypothetical protein MAP00_006644 [Monascus purpureus]